MIKMKKIYLIFLGMLLITFVTAGIIIDAIVKDAIIIIPEKNNTRFEGNITFKVDGKDFSCYLDEPNLDIDDDFEQDCLKGISGEVTDIYDWNGRKYKEITLNQITYRSFDNTKLNKLKEDYEKSLEIEK